MFTSSESVENTIYIHFEDLLSEVIFDNLIDQIHES